MVKIAVIASYIFLVILIAYLFKDRILDPLAIHPGKLASDGCHFCKTNCNNLGYTSNTRHGHTGAKCNPNLGPIDPKY